MALKGNLRDMDLTTLISVNCNEGNQAALRLQRGDEEALVYFDEGQIVHAIWGDKEGEDVIYDILSWDEASFELERDVPSPTRTIHTVLRDLPKTQVSFYARFLLHRRAPDRSHEPPVSTGVTSRRTYGSLAEFETTHTDVLGFRTPRYAEDFT